MNCSKCKKPIPEDSEFCPYCGNVVDRTMLPLCGNCGRAVPEDSEFCPYCGTAVLQDLSTKCSKCGKDIPDDVEPPVNAIQKEKKKKPWIWLVPVVVILILAGIAFGGRDNGMQGSYEDSRKTSLKDAAEAVLYLEMYDNHGDLIGSASGFLVENQTTLVTNYHVVQDAYRIVACTNNGSNSVEANLLLAYDESADLAILKCDSSLDIHPLNLADSDNAEQGDQVYAVGYPLGLANTLSDGVISSRYYDEYGIDTVQVTAAISEGNSGGPLLNEDGQVVGVVCAYYEDGQNLNVGVASNTLLDLLDEEASPVNIKYWNNRPSLPWEADLEAWASVTLDNLQGTWVGTYSTGSTSTITISGDYGVFTVSGVPGGEGTVTINDRSQFGLCPEVIFDDGKNKCTIYILYVTDDHFYSQGSNLFYYKQNSINDDSNVEKSVTEKILEKYGLDPKVYGY